MRPWLAVVVLVLATAAAPPVASASAPAGDAYGYTATAMRSSYVEGGTRTTLRGDLTGRHQDFPFPVTFYGNTYTGASIYDDGYLTFEDRNPVPPPGPLPSPTPPNAAVYAFWDDLVVDDQAGVWTGVDGVTPNRRFVVEWRDVTVKAVPGTRFSAEAVFHEGGRIVLQYRGIDQAAEAGAGAVVGIENAAGTSALTWSAWRPALSDGVAVQLRVPGTAIARGKVTDANTGEPVRYAAVRVAGAANAAKADWYGEYQVQVPARKAAIEITSDGYAAGHATPAPPAENTLVRADVVLDAPVLVSGEPVEITVRAGTGRTATAPIHNRGTAPGTWSAAAEIASGTAVPRPDRPGATLRTWNPEAAGVPAGYGIAELGGDVWVSSRRDHTLTRLTPDGVALQHHRLPATELLGDLTTVGDALCYVSDRQWDPMTSTTRCIRPLTGEVVHTTTTTGIRAGDHGLAHNARDDIFYLVDGKTVHSVKGPSHPDAGALVGSCSLSGHDRHNHVAGIAYAPNGPGPGLLWLYLVSADSGRPPLPSFLSAVTPDGCASRATLPDPVPGDRTGAGLETDAAGNL
ncbi:hypothetical protein [Saccharothrix obliqua]|uniref:hypothetical protein n=1 Tax=Saccharothrix obliqua TaxID=2861747 RepID=UPI001C5F13C3|nr:hypothetical protein [Saccharothrix obliqua]MBW4718646.1 hypothetical protein [Saccharothrix obliqua]